MTDARVVDSEPFAVRPSGGRPAMTPEALAARVDGALDRADRVLFTVTPREELDAFAQWQRLADQAWCGQLRQVVAATARMNADQRDFAGEELALSLGIAPVDGQVLVWSYGAIAALPGLVEAVEAGQLSRPHVEAFMRVLASVSLTLEQRQAITLVALAEYAGETPGEWAQAVRRLVLQVDPQAAARRRKEKAAERHVSFYPLPDEQGGMFLQAPVELLARAKARVQAEARRRKAAGDERSSAQLQCDIVLELLTDGTLNGQPVPAFQVAVITPLSVLEGGEGTGEVVGWGPVSADTTRELAGQASSFTQVTVDTDGQVIAVNDPVRADRLRTHDDDQDQQEVAVEGQPGPKPVPPALRAPCPIQLDRYLREAAQAMRAQPQLRDLTGSGYRPSTRLTRFLHLRDRTCVFPGCPRPATQTDIDHRIPWPRGKTSPDNTQCLCRRHHRAKHSPAFTVLLDHDGTIVWITRGGWSFHRPPKGYH